HRAVDRRSAPADGEELRYDPGLPQLCRGDAQHGRPGPRGGQRSDAADGRGGLDQRAGPEPAALAARPAGVAAASVPGHRAGSGDPAAVPDRAAAHLRDAVDLAHRLRDPLHAVRNALLPGGTDPDPPRAGGGGLRQRGVVVGCLPPRAAAAAQPRVLGRLDLRLPALGQGAVDVGAAGRAAVAGRVGDDVRPVEQRPGGGGRGVRRDLDGRALGDGRGLLHPGPPLRPAHRLSLSLALETDRRKDAAMDRRARFPGQRWAVFAVILGLAAACVPAAPPSTAKPAGSAASGQTSDPAAAAPEKIVRGGTFVIGMHGDLVNFDVVTQTAALHLSVMSLVQSGLMKWGKSTVVDPTKLACDLCESWTQIDPTTYEFKLRQGVRWHNVPPVNGRELVADDVKYTLERLKTGNFRNDPRFGRNQSKVASIESIETPDKYTLRVKLKAPDAAFLWHMGDPFVLIVAREQVEAESDGILQSGLVGTGPFILKEFTPKVGYTLVRNPDYFQPGLPYLDAVEVRVIMDNTTRANAFRAKEIHDPGMFMDAEKKRIIDRSHPDLFMGEVPGMTTAGIYFNTTRPPFDDARVRRAINLAIDRQGIIDATRFGHAVLTRWLSPSVGIYATPENEVAKLPGYRQPKDQDVATARRLLAEAGYPNGFSTELKVIRSANIPADAEVIAAQLRRRPGRGAGPDRLDQRRQHRPVEERPLRRAVRAAAGGAGPPGAGADHRADDGPPGRGGAGAHHLHRQQLPRLSEGLPRHPAGAPLQRAHPLHERGLVRRGRPAQVAG